MGNMDQVTRKLPRWRLSNTMRAEFRVEALKDAISHV